MEHAWLNNYPIECVWGHSGASRFAARAAGVILRRRFVNPQLLRALYPLRRSHPPSLSLWRRSGCSALPGSACPRSSSSQIPMHKPSQMAAGPVSESREIRLRRFCVGKTRFNCRICPCGLSFAFSPFRWRDCARLRPDGARMAEHLSNRVRLGA